ncbi:ABATE domain-containing protein [Actinoallomurus sp. NPDC052274]|uniref:CGNR zinc finger domain-containing protein n=1 Tax=Actinoallomurus sp. NPDC052274 TaxID=3155420 RepID=UPI003413A36F
MFTFLGNRPSLDLTATVLFRHHTDPTELLVHAGEVGEWARQAGLVDQPMEVDELGLTRTRALREAIYRMAHAVMRRESFAPADVDLVNTAAMTPPLNVSLIGSRLRRSGGVTQLHSTLARDALELFGGDSADRVRECSGSDCTRIYFDTSRNASRRWCGMNQCGDRVKAANYRARRREAAR